MTWSPLMTHKMENTVDRSSRNGVRVDSIGHHHAATTSRDGALSAFIPGGREVTPNYCVWEDEIWGIVDEDFRAWTSASAQDDSRSITYEIVNASGDPSWTISERTLATVARLDDEIAKRYGIQRVHAIPGFWEHRNLNEWFGRSYATTCAGPGFDINKAISRSLSPTGPNTEGIDMIVKDAGPSSTQGSVAIVGEGVKNNFYIFTSVPEYDEFAAVRNFMGISTPQLKDVVGISPSRFAMLRKIYEQPSVSGGGGGGTIGGLEEILAAIAAGEAQDAKDLASVLAKIDGVDEATAAAFAARLTA